MSPLGAAIMAGKEALNAENQ